MPLSLSEYAIIKKINHIVKNDSKINEIEIYESKIIEFTTSFIG